MTETTDGNQMCLPQPLNDSCRKTVQPQSESLLLSTALSFMSVLTAALNLLVIFSISYFRQLHSPTNLLILSLAVSDFLVGLLLMPIEILFTEAHWFLSDFVYALLYFVSFTITSSSVGNMVLISIDRYLAICDPLHYTSRVTLDRTMASVCLCWLCSLLYNGFILKDFLRQPSSPASCYSHCVVVFNYLTGVIDCVFTFIGPITVIVLLYVRVFMVAVSQAHAMRVHVAAVTLQSSVSSAPKKSELKAARSLGVVVLVFLICFCPYYSSSMVGQDIEDGSTYSTYVVWLLYLNSCVNPVIYAFFYPWFRKSVRLIVTLQILHHSCDTKIQ